MEKGDFYLWVARGEHERLARLRGKPRYPRFDFKRRVHHPPSAHYRHAIACSVFSAFAVEYELKRFISVRMMFQSRAPERRVLRAMWSERPNVQQMLSFLRAASSIEKGLRDEIKALFDYRNGLAHARFEMDEFEQAQQTGDPTIIQRVNFPQLDPADLKKAAWSLGVATRAFGALREATDATEWRASRQER